MSGGDEGAGRLKLCRHCVWYRPTFFGFGHEFAKCGNHEVSPVSLNLVTGIAKQKFEYADIARRRERSCGPDAKLWSPKS